MHHEDVTIASVFFLLQQGYDTCYCTRLAPNKENRTCRQVGAVKKHRTFKERTPAQVEYDRAYTRLKARKRRGKLTTEQWNEAVAQALEIKRQAECGEIMDNEMKKRFYRL